VKQINKVHSFSFFFQCAAIRSTMTTIQADIRFVNHGPWVITEISVLMLLECVTLQSLSQATVMNEGFSGQFLATQSVRAWFES
jgi:hypothetical protein